MNDPNTIHKEVVVEAPQEHAFRVFTERFDTWWPKTHHIGKSDMKEAILEPKLNGRWYEKDVDGSECDWGKVIAWDPPRRVAVTWQLTHDYQYDPNFVTEVEVTFEALATNKTRVVLQHKHLDRYGEMRDQIKKSVGSEEGGWGLLMNAFAAEAEGDTKRREELHQLVA